MGGALASPDVILSLGCVVFGETWLAEEDILVPESRLQFNNTKYSALLKLLAAVLEGALPGSSIVLLGYFNAHV